LDCVVFGRVAGRTASKYMSGADGKFRMYPIEQRDKEVSRIIIS
jgi:succinate dehydrogenase/fumarate reductase flavoprotein subunit